MLDKTTLEKILADPESTAEERELAQRELVGMGIQPITATPTVTVLPLVAELLRFTGASSLADVTDQDVYNFLDARQSPTRDRESLFQEFTAYKVEVQRDPLSVAGAREVGNRLRAYLVERVTGLMERLRAATEAGKPTHAIHDEINELCRDWQNSAALPESMKAPLRRILEKLEKAKYANG